MVEAPQEFDEKGKELGPDAQVWKTYVREADQVDEELVDGWNKSMDVMLIVFAALFSAISTAFVIESYRNLKQDPTDISSRTLFTISQTLMFIANGSEPSNVPLTFETEVSPFHPSAKAICVNVLWFSSLSLSVAVSLISMLAKEWCLEYMTGRTGPAGAQARRRQQRWDGLVKWRMRELIMMLPSLIHLSLLLFAIGLCIFLWDVHYGVAIPVIIITLIAAGAYLACTIVPFLYDYCPYATVLSRLFKQLITIGSQLGRDNVIQDEITANALNWMIVNCETPRSVDIALQSLAAADENLPTRVLEQRHAWVMVKQRLECGEVDKQFERNQKVRELYARALEVYPITRRKIDLLDYGYFGREEQLVLGIQATIQSLIDSFLPRVDPKDITTRQLLDRCTSIGQYHLSQAFSHAIGHNQASDKYKALVEPEGLAEALVNQLEQYLTGKIAFDFDLYYTLSASLAFLLCCHAARGHTGQSVNISYVLRLIRGYSSGLGSTAPESLHQKIAPNLVLGTLWLLISSASPDDEPWRINPLPKALEYLWATLMAITYSDSSALKRLDVTYLAYGMWYLRTNPNLYNLSRDDCATIKMALNWTQSANEPSNRIQSIYHAYYIHRLSHDITTMADRDSFAPLVLMAVDRLRRYSPWDGYYVLPTSEIYTLVIKYLCTTNDTTSLDCWNGYWILAYSPIPKLSPRLVQELSSSDSITHLSNAMHSEDHHTRVFAAAQLWVLFSMSIYEADRTNPALSALEAELLKYPRLENSLERQEAVAEELEAKLMALREVVYSHLEEYISRVMEVMLQRRSAPLPRSTDSVLKRIPRRLCGIESFVNYETERSIAYPDLVFDSEGRPSPAPSGQE
ncbi:unnamed protein product [Rhizoctonia solani]|uniref:DUF6535 domain-containing protein n=1 Tax=Rhizoctonia solani TaxID=456999 RepID=A0A8H3EA95_9AGAM|nr:unnamed protein product [Rhizoctonia solani]